MDDFTHEVIKTAYEQWHESGDWVHLSRCVEAGNAHWASLAKALLAYQGMPVQSARHEIKALVEARVL